MKSDYLHTFIISITSGSFSKAAESLCVTQSAVSRRIQQLEDQYGFSLINRNGPILVPTEAGRIVLEKAIRMLDLEKELAQDLNVLRQKACVGFGCSPAFGIAYLPQIMKVFMLSHSTVTGMNFSFEVPDKVLEGLREGSYRAGVIEHFEDYDFSGFESMAMPDDKVVFVSSPSLNIKQNATIDQLIAFDIYMRKEGCCSTKLLAFNMVNINRNSNEFSRTIVCDDLHLIINSVCEGNGITFVSRSLVDHHIQQGTLKEHRLPLFQHTQHRTLIVKSQPADLLLKDFIDCILAVFEIPTLHAT
ncbi:MAG: LysR family transcriptional regulator [Desulfobulbaceae bacterium]|nr:LysR family transcriptional regulator [Desulfobulbaceae bacterium]HIJ90587.1 LysR family transcriptional regulator [Deltaproteobacteria bacterium]